MARDKEFESRMQGMRYAYDIVKAQGIEGLQKEINRRGITKFPFTTSASETNKIWSELSTNMYVNITVTFMSVLMNEFGFDKEKLLELREKYDKAVRDALDVDYMGEHYVRLEDYAVELNEMGLEFDVNRIASCQDHFDETADESKYHTVKVERIIKELENKGYTDAAHFLANKIE